MLVHNGLGLELQECRDVQAASEEYGENGVKEHHDEIATMFGVFVRHPTTLCVAGSRIAEARYTVLHVDVYVHVRLETHVDGG